MCIILKSWESILNVGSVVKSILIRGMGFALYVIIDPISKNLEKKILDCTRKGKGGIKHHTELELF
jgi:hypothetical protein